MTKSRLKAVLEEGRRRPAWAVEVAFVLTWVDDFADSVELEAGERRSKGVGARREWVGGCMLGFGFRARGPHARADTHGYQSRHT